MGAALKLKPEDNKTTKPVGTVKGTEYFDVSNKKVGYYKGDEFFTASHFKVGYVKTGWIFDSTNQKVMSLVEAKKTMNCDYEGPTLAGYWYFFGRTK